MPSLGFVLGRDTRFLAPRRLQFFRLLAQSIEGAPQDTVLYVQLFPNLLISGHPDYVMTHRMIPLSAGRTWVECSWLFPVHATEQPTFDPAFAMDFWDITNREDWAACESVYRGLDSGFAEAGPLSPDEEAVYQFVTMVARGYSGLPVSARPHLSNASANERVPT